MNNIEKLKKYFKTQKEIYDFKGNGICFPVAMYNIFPKFYKDKEDLKQVCEDFDKKDRTLDEILDYFNNKLQENNINNQFVLVNMNTVTHSLDNLKNFLKEYSNNLMILLFSSRPRINNGHAVAYLGYDLNNILFFENKNTDLIDMCSEGFLHSLKNKKITKYNNELISRFDTIDKNVLREFFIEKFIKKGEIFSSIDIEFLYYGTFNLYFIRLKDNNDSKLINYSSRLDMLQVSKDFRLTSYIKNDNINIILNTKDIVKSE